MTTTLRLRLIDDWKRAWRWSSVRLLAIAVAVQTTLLAFPLKDYVPQWIISTLATAALLITLAAGLGRITTTEPANEPQSPPPSQ